MKKVISGFILVLGILFNLSFISAQNHYYNSVEECETILKTEKRTKADFSNLEELNKKFDNDADSIQEKMLKYEQCFIGLEIPAFDELSIHNIEVTKSSILGKPTIMNFWYSTCPPCVAEIPGFNKIVEKYGDKVNYLAFGNENQYEIEEFLMDQSWSFIHIPNSENIKRNTFRFGLGYPTTVVLNAKAEIIEIFAGGLTDERAIQQIQDKIIPVIEKELK